MIKTDLQTLPFEKAKEVYDGLVYRLARPGK